MANRIEIIGQNCIGCGLCIKSCPFAAITLIDKEHTLVDGKQVKNLAVIDLSKCNYCSACLDACKKYGAIIIEKEVEKPAVDVSQYRGVWVYAEQRHNKISPVVYELLNKGRELANKLNCELSAVLIGDKKISEGGCCQELIHHGADKVYLVEDEIFSEFLDDPYSEVLAKLIEDEKPEIVLMGATNIGRSFASRVAAKIKTGLTADCTGLDIEGGDKRNLVQTRPAFGGNIMATILTERHRPQMATVRHKVFKKASCDTSRQGKVIKKDLDLSKIKNRIKFLEFIEDTTAKVNLSEADIIVSGGRGLGRQEGFKLIEEFADVLGGAVGASRAAVDSGWIPYSHQVGQTGRTVAPKVYVACGISGQIQHLVGMSSSEVIVAINRDPEAPMMKIATYALEGDLYEIIPAIIKEIKEIKEIKK
ncbi:MAG: electron transfer flavoprotein subunit alpha [Elusimicrobiota bacterium]|nr:electron transfer flavoprotein subunit alpha [Elusimicrobiota bacterium]